MARQLAERDVKGKREEERGLTDEEVRIAREKYG